MNRILAIVVTYNSMEWIDRCLGSVRESSLPADIFVIDNCSSDGSADYVEKNFPEAKLVRSASNSGFGAANNIALKYALEKGYEYVYLLNADAWIYPDTLSVLVGAMEDSDGSYGILSPLQFAAPGPDARGCGYLDRNFVKKCAARINDGGDAPIIEVPFVMAAHWLISRECLSAVGGFSPTFPHYGEDDNYVDRARYFGFCTGVVPGASAVHDRALRPETKESKMKHKCLSAVVKVSDPNRPFAITAIVEVFELLGMAVKNRSTAPLKYIPVFLRGLKGWKANRRESTLRNSPVCGNRE